MWERHLAANNAVLRKAYRGRMPLPQPLTPLFDIKPESLISVKSGHFSKVPKKGLGLQGTLSAVVAFATMAEPTGEVGSLRSE